MMSLLTDLLMAKVPGSSSKSESAESIQGSVEFTQTFENVLNGTLEESVNADGSSPISEVPLSAGEHPLPINATEAPTDSDAQGVADEFKASIHNTVSGETMDSSIPAGTPAGSAVDSANQPSGSTGSTSNTATSDLVNWPGVAFSNGVATDATMLPTGTSAMDLMGLGTATSNVPQAAEGLVLSTSSNATSVNGGSLNGSGAASSSVGAIDSMTLPTGVSATDLIVSGSSARNVLRGTEGQVASTGSSGSSENGGSLNGSGAASSSVGAIDSMTLPTGVSATDLIVSGSSARNVLRGTEGQVASTGSSGSSENSGSLNRLGLMPSQVKIIDPTTLPTGGSAAGLLASGGAAGNDSQGTEGVLSKSSSADLTTRASLNVPGQVISNSYATNSLNQPRDTSQTDALRAETASQLTSQTSTSSQSPLPTARPGGEPGDRDALTMAMLSAGNSARTQGVQQASPNPKAASAFVQSGVSESVSLQTQIVDADVPIGRMPSPELATPRNAVAAAAEPTVGPVATTPVATSATVSSSSSLLANDVAPRDQHQFANDMATHVRVLKGQGGGEAKLNLHPMELGRMSITVATEGSETKVMFVVETAQARQSVEAAMPRLREMLDQAGLSLTDSDVAERKDQPQSGDRETWSSEESAGFATTQDADTEVLQISVSMDSERLLDTFA